VVLLYHKHSKIYHSKLLCRTEAYTKYYVYAAWEVFKIELCTIICAVSFQNDKGFTTNSQAK